MSEIFVTPPELAARLKVKVETLNVWRSLKKGPKYENVGGGRGRVRYRLTDIEAWEKESNTKGAGHGSE